jgi:peptide/nickel transport system permease protein
MGKSLKRSRVTSTAWVCIGIIVLFSVLAIFAEILTPYSPSKTSLPETFLPPFFENGGTLRHPLGTDALGRDLLTRIIYGARVSLAVAFIALGLGAAFGVAVGIVAGFMGGWIDAVLMRLTDAMLCLDVTILALILAASRGASFGNILICVGIVIWARWSRVIRVEVLGLKNREFIDLARVAGVSDIRIMVQHILPNVFNTVLVMISLQVGWVIIAEAALSFIGAGIPPPTPSWGNMVAEGREWITTAWWISFFPGVAIMFVVLAFNLFGDWLRDALDPKLRQI